MRREVVLTQSVSESGLAHLLHHYSANIEQEDLCFGLWRQSTGARRKTAIVYDLIKPDATDRNLHGNVSFEPHYLSRVIRKAKQEDAGVAFLHSHPTAGWQDMSRHDVIAERDIISYPARITGKPLVGLTVGRDGYWSARWWESSARHVERFWCNKVRVLGKSNYMLYGQPRIHQENQWSARLRRTQDSWGPTFQKTLEELVVGVVGVGSVGCIAVEAMARIGVGEITLIDHDRVEEHNLDRLLYGAATKIGQRKIDIGAEALQEHGTNSNLQIHRVGHRVESDVGYRSALDCDIILSCVDRPIGRDVLNYVAQAHMIPVIDAGVSVEAYRMPRRFFNAHWRTHLVTPEHECLRCTGQYDSGNVVAELDGSLSDPVYIKGLEEAGIRQNINTFPFALGVAGLQVNLALRYLLGEKWWPEVSRQEFQFIKGTVVRESRGCGEGCSFRKIVATGDANNPPYLRTVKVTPEGGRWRSRVRQVYRDVLNKLFVDR